MLEVNKPVLSKFRLFIGRPMIVEAYSIVLLILSVVNHIANNINGTVAVYVWYFSVQLAEARVGALPFHIRRRELPS